MAARTNASAAEETASASEELNAQAKSLQRAVERVNVLVGGHTRREHADEIAAKAREV